MFAVILLTVMGWILEAGLAYSLYRVIAKRLPAMLYRILLTWVIFQVVNSLAALTTWFAFGDDFSLLLFYLILTAFACPFALWAFFDRRREPIALKDALANSEKSFLISFGILFLALFLSTARYGFMPQWGNVDMANQVNAINAFHAKMLPGWIGRTPFVVQAAPVLGEAIGLWGYIFGYNFLTALLARLTFTETIYILNLTSSLNMALWLSAPLLLTDWKKAKVWTILYWLWIVFSVSGWYSAVDRGWLTSIYSIGQCVVVLACLFYMVKQGVKSRALLYVSIGLGSFMVANAHPYNYPIFLLSVVLMALFSGEKKYGKRLLRALGYGAVGVVMLAPLIMQSAFEKVANDIFGFISTGDLAGILSIRDFKMLTSAKAPMWLGVAGMLAAVAVVLILVRTVRKSYIVGISAVATVLGLYAVYGSGGYLYQKESFLAPPLFFMFALQLICDLWQLVYHKWIEKKAKHSCGRWETYVVIPVLIASLLISGQIDLQKGITHIRERFIDVQPMIEPAYYGAAKAISVRDADQGGRGPVNFRPLDGARKMFLSRIVREDDLSQLIPALPYYAVESTSYGQIIQFISMTPDEEISEWEDGWYLVHDTQERGWPGYRAMASLMSGEERIFTSGNIAVTEMWLDPEMRFSYIPLAGGVVPVRVERTNTKTIYIEGFGQGTMACTTDAPAVLGMENPLKDIPGDLLLFFRGSVTAPGRITVRILDADGMELAYRILPEFRGMTTLQIPAETLTGGAARFEIVMEPGNISSSAVMQWMCVFAIPGE